MIEEVRSLVEQEWAGDLVRGWSKDGWWETPLRVGDKLGRLIGAASGQVAAGESTSVSLYKLAMAALNLQTGREEVISDILNFPSDLYILQGCVQQTGGGHRLRLVPSTDGISPDLDALDNLLSERTAVVALSHACFKSGYLYDMAAITDRAHRHGALVIWDLSHSVGVAPVELDHWDVDMAAGCTYKYLNGGPGSPGFLYVNRRLQEQVLSPIWGWFGQRLPFAFDLEYKPAPGIARFLAGSPPQLSLRAVEAALDLPLQAGMQPIRKKSEMLTRYAIFLFDEILSPLGFSLGTPREAARRGSHISLRHPEGYRINRVLIEEMKVLPDFREPDFIRLGFAPLYTTYEEVWQAIHLIAEIVREKRYLAFAGQREAIT